MIETENNIFPWLSTNFNQTIAARNSRNPSLLHCLTCSCFIPHQPYTIRLQEKKTQPLVPTELSIFPLASLESTATETHVWPDKVDPMISDINKCSILREKTISRMEYLYIRGSQRQNLCSESPNN